MKDFTHLHSEESEDQLRRQPPKDDVSRNKKILLAGLFIVMLACTLVNLSIQSPQPSDLPVIVEQPTPTDPLSQTQEPPVEVEEYVQRRNVTRYHVPFSKKAQQRRALGQPRPKNSTLKAVIIEKTGTIAADSTCVLTNGVNVISSKTTTTALNLLAQASVSKWIVFLGLADEVADNLMNKLEPNLTNMTVTRVKEVVIDADYNFITQHTTNCSSVIYLQNPFVVDRLKASQLARTVKDIKQEHKQAYVAYTQTLYNEQGTQMLENLKKADLYNFDQQKINHYIYVFDSNLLKVITPLNFVHFNKYTFEQLIIYPLLALTQNSDMLFSMKGPFHTFDEITVQFKQFALTQVQQNQHYPCFVATPSIPSEFQLEQTQDYIKAFNLIQANQTNNISLVVNLPYNIKSKSTDTQIQAYKELKQLCKKFKNLKIRIRMHYQRAVSSLAAYESAHTYCPKSSIMIMSRLNIQFTKSILKQVLNAASQRFHYYHTGKLNLKDDEKLIDVMIKSRSKQRFNVFKFNSDFSHVQIFKTQFMKMVHLWALKSDENKFYQTQASFVIPMLEMIGYDVWELETLYKISDPRKSSTIQTIEVKRLQRYGTWEKISHNVLHPIPYDSLTNLDLRRNKINEIPKIIHQVWFKQEKMPESLRRIQSSIREVNKGYKYILWRRDNLTFHDFPMCYNFVAKALEYEWATGKNLQPWVQTLVSYEVLHNFGGFYFASNAQAKKPLDSFLKYELFFAGFYSEYGLYQSPLSISHEIIGARRNNYHLRFVLSELITDQILDFQCADYQAIVGGDILRASLLEEQLFTTVGFGFNLVNYDPHRADVRGLCDMDEVPCKQHEEAYVVFHTFI